MNPQYCLINRPNALDMSQEYNSEGKKPHILLSHYAPVSDKAFEAVETRKPSPSILCNSILVNLGLIKVLYISLVVRFTDNFFIIPPKWFIFPEIILCQSCSNSSHKNNYAFICFEFNYISVFPLNSFMLQFVDHWWKFTPSVHPATGRYFTQLNNGMAWEWNTLRPFQREVSNRWY